VKPALAAAILKSFARSLTLIEASAIAPSPRLPPFEALLQRFRRSRSPQESRF
jgi:ATP-dependent DNA ligase